jgi:cystinosin
MDLGEILSLTFASANMILWVFVLVPQIKLNYRLKSSAGMSFLLVFLWLFGGILSLTSAIGNGAALMIVCIGIHHIIKDLLLLSVLLYYRKNDHCTFFSITEVIVAISFVIIAIVVLFTSSAFLAIFAWSSVFILSLSRVPQILLTFLRKSTRGLSLKSFVIVGVTNLCFAAGLFVKLVDMPISDLVKTNLPWIIGCAITFACDLIIILQFFLFRNKNQTFIRHHIRPDGIRVCISNPPVGGLYDIVYYKDVDEYAALYNQADTDTDTDNYSESSSEIFFDTPRAEPLVVGGSRPVRGGVPSPPDGGLRPKEAFAPNPPDASS